MAAAPVVPAVAPLPPAVVRLEGLMLQHPLHKSGKARLARHHARSISRLAGASTAPLGLLILGDSRMGKSWLLRDYASAHPIVSRQSVEDGGPGLPEGVRWSLDDGEYRPIVQCSVPSNGDLRAFVSAILGAFGYTTRETWDTPTIVAQIAWYVREMGTQMIFIDEGHNLFSRRDDVSTADIIEFLKQLLNDVPCEFVIAGLPELRGITRFAPQLRGRMDAPIRMRAYQWSTPYGLRNFVGLLRRFEREFGLRQPSGIDSFDFARRLYVASLDGRIGWVVKLLSGALREAIALDLPWIDLELLGAVYADLEYDDDDRAVPAEGGAPASTPQPDFLNEEAFNRAIFNRTAALAAPSLPTELNPFLCDQRHLVTIRSGLLLRLDVERQALSRTMEGAARVTRLRPKAARTVTAFGGG